MLKGLFQTRSLHEIWSVLKIGKPAAKGAGLDLLTD